MANFPSHINGISSFKGFRLVHGSQFPGAIPSHGQNKKAIVIGCGTSAHDIAQDFYENGYSTTMVQRSSTLVISSENLSSALSALYSEDGPPILDADMLYHSTANPVTKRINISLTKAQNKVDEQLLNGLEKVGFKINMGPDNSGLWITYLQHGGGYYIDVGCSQLIIDGKIKIKQGQEIAEILPHGVKFADGEVLEADEIVFATGYQNMRTQCRNIFGDELANKVHDIWGFDKEGELRTVWRNSGHPGFWFAGGNLSLCRWFSRLLALQIKGLEEGLYKHDNL
jgi:cation diffusion facilitator CzcD-associated flavoprotein CzcO